jgi:hypothetical protein
MSARKNHVDERTFRVATKLIMNLNDIPTVSIAAASRMVRSAGFEVLRLSNEPMWAAVSDTVRLAAALGGHVPVRYYLHEAQEGHGRLKA